MKKLLLFLALSLPLFIQAQLTSEDFESYELGAFDGQFDPAEWTGWFGNNSGTVISDDQANSGTKSVRVLVNEDLVALLGTLNNGIYEITFWQYIPSGSGAYFNMQHNYTNSAGDWACELYFSDEITASAFIRTNAVDYPFSIVHDSWVENRFVFNFSMDQAEYYYHGVLIHTWQISTNAGGGAGLNQINGINLFGTCLGAGCTSTAYYDDITVDFTPPPAFDAAITSFSAPSEYTNVPLGHVQPFSFSAEVTNFGADAVTDLDVTANVYDGSNNLVHSETIGSASSLGSGESMTFNLPVSTYTPTMGDAYTVEYIASISEMDAEDTNNIGSETYFFAITDSTYARDDGVYDNGIGANNTSALLGHTYDILINEEVTGISMSYGGGGVGEYVQGHIFSLNNGVPDALLFSTDSVMIEMSGSVGAEIFLDLVFPDAAPLLPGEYGFMVEQKGITNLLLSTSPNIYTPGSTLASLDDGATWDNLEDFGFLLAMNIRPIFGNTTVSTEEPEAVTALSLAPNPTKGQTILSLNLSESHDLQLDVFNLQGQNIYSTFDESVSGDLQYEINLDHLPDGMYIARVTIDGKIVSRKINLVK